MCLNIAIYHLVVSVGKQYLPPFLMFSLFNTAFSPLLLISNMSINSCFSPPPPHAHDSCGKFFTARTGHSCPKGKADFQLKIGSPGSLSLSGGIPLELELGGWQLFRDLHYTRPRLGMLRHGFHFAISLNISRSITAYSEDSTV